MDPEILAQYGVAIFAIGTLGWVVKYLGDIIKNHISHNSEIMNELGKANQKLADTIDQLLDWLMRANNKK